MTRSGKLIAPVVLALSCLAAPASAATILLQPTRGPSGTMVHVHACGNPTGPFSLPVTGHFIIRVDNVQAGPPIEGVPCQGGGAGFGQGTGRPPAVVRVDGAPGPRRVSVEFQGQGANAPIPAATFIIDPPGTPPPANAPGGQGSGNPPPPGTTPGPGSPAQPSTTSPAKIAWLDLRDGSMGGVAETELTFGLAGQGGLYHLRIRNDAMGSGHQRLLELLVQAFSQNWTVVLTFDTPANAPATSGERVVTGVRVSR